MKRMFPRLNAVNNGVELVQQNYQLVILPLPFLCTMYRNVHLFSSGSIFMVFSKQILLVLSNSR